MNFTERAKEMVERYFGYNAGIGQIATDYSAPVWCPSVKQGEATDIVPLKSVARNLHRHPKTIRAHCKALNINVHQITRGDLQRLAESLCRAGHRPNLAEARKAAASLDARLKARETKKLKKSLRSVVSRK